MIAGGLIDVNDLLRGEGEWRNMQDIVRKAFKHCLDVQHTQNEKISRLTAQVTQLREELNKRPTCDDIDRLIEIKLLAEKKRQGSGPLGDTDNIRLQIAQLNREIEKKVSIQYLESSLNKKMDRSDLLIRDLSKYSVKEYSQEVAKLKLDVVEMKSHLEHFTDIMEEYERKTSDFPKTSEQVIVLKSQIENLYRHLNEVYTKDQLKPLLEDKITRVEVDTMLSQKADTSNLYSFTARLEHALEHHEKLITALRLSANDPSLFHQDVFLRKSSKPISSNENKSPNLPGIGGDLEDVLKDGRIESVINGLWNRMNSVLKEYDHMKKIMKSMDDEMKAFRVVIKGVAAIEKVELLAVVVEEQRLRIDAIFQGSTKIAPIQKELRRFDERIKEIHDFLKLPQPKKLTDMLNDITNFAQDLSKELMDIGTVIHSTIAPKLDVTTSRIETLEARWDDGLNDRNRLEHLADYVNLTGSSFNNVRDIALSLRELWGIVDNRKYDTLCNPPVQSVLNRLSDLEGIQSKSLELIESHRQKIQKLNELINTSASSYRETSRSASPHNARNRDRKEKRNKSPTRKLDDDFVADILGESLSPIIASDEVFEEIDKVASVARTSAPSAASVAVPPAAASQPSIVHEDITVPQSGNFPTHFSSRRQTSPAANVDFEAVLGDLFNSLEDMKVPIKTRGITPFKHFNNGTQPVNDDSDLFLMSIAEVDARLAELNREKQRIRENLFAKAQL